MVDSFKNILIPVDLSINTAVAIEKGLELADKNARLHLLYINHNSLQGMAAVIGGLMVDTDAPVPENSTVGQKLENWKRKIELGNENIKVDITILDESGIQLAIEKMAVQLSADLIVIGKKSRHAWFPFLNTVVSNQIARHTGIPVLTVKPGSIHNKVKKVIISISNGSIVGKLNVISMICKKVKVKIHLVTFVDENGIRSDSNVSSLLEVYKWLKTSVHCEVDYAVLHGNSKARAILDFALKINADILLVQPKLETQIDWMNRHISDMLPPDSKIEVLSV